MKAHLQLFGGLRLQVALRRVLRAHLFESASTLGEALSRGRQLHRQPVGHSRVLFGVG